MNYLDRLTDSFKTKYERFLIGCDSVEMDDVWDKSEYGEMDVYYENELITEILSVIVSDGVIGNTEVSFINRNFGFSCTEEDLRALYKNCGDEIDAYFESHFKAGYALLRRMNEKLAAAYAELFELIKEIITESDGVVNEAEKRKLAALALQ